MYDSARQKAIRRIAIIPTEDKSGKADRYGALGDILVDKIISGIMSGRADKEFMEIITRDRMNQVLQEQQLSISGLVDERSAARLGVLLGAHEILSCKLLQVNYNSPKVLSINLKESANIEIEAENQEGGNQKMEISCVFTKFTVNASAQAVASYSLVDVSSGRVMAQETFNTSSTYEDSWIRIQSGDVRALSPMQKSLAAKNEPIPPSEIEMVNSAVVSLSSNILNHFLKTVK